LKKLNSILVVLDSFEPTQQVVAKAMVMARHFGAFLELFLCDSEHAYVLKHAYDKEGMDGARQHCLANARSYLESLRRSVLTDDVQISIDVACDSPLYVSVVHKVLRSRPDLVIRNVTREQTQGRFSFDAKDWELARTCPVPLMLTYGRPWRAQPSFAAAVDMSENELVGMVRAIMQSAKFLARGCHADLDALYSDCYSTDTTGHGSRVAALHDIGTEFGIAADRLHVLSGNPETTLPAFAAERHYDVLVLGALTHRRALTALVGSLTNKIVDALDCDFVLLRPEGSFGGPLSVNATIHTHVVDAPLVTQTTPR
jgi:universal stress protein E